MDDFTIDRIAIPEQMDRAIMSCWNTCGIDPKVDSLGLVYACMRSGLLALAREPLVPSVAEVEAMDQVWDAIPESDDLPDGIADQGAWTAIEWQRRMFLRREPELPEIVGEWPASTCVECGLKMEAGCIRKCSAGGEMGSGNCTHHVPSAIRRAMDSGKKASK